MTIRPHILIIDGSIHGRSGNTAVVLDVAREKLSSRGTSSTIYLSENIQRENILSEIERANGFIFATGTYWDSWGSPLQKFFETMTETEGSPLWLGKPAAVAVTMHSVGGKGVLSRVQGVLNTFGVLIPPMCGLVCSAVNQMAISHSTHKIADDLWRPDDLKIVCHNLLEAAQGSSDWHTWPLDREAFDKLWVER